MAPDLLSRVAHLKKALERLTVYRQKAPTWEAFLANEDLIAGVERYFQTAIQSLVDIANHLIALKHWRKPESAADSFLVLAEGGWLSHEMAREMEGWVKFRNIIVHEYAEIDLEEEYERLTKGLDRLRKVLQELGPHLP